MAQITVGRPDVDPDTPAHTKGVRQGNARRGYRHQVGHHMDGTADARRSTGINPKRRNPIRPQMPNLSPG